MIVRPPVAWRVPIALLLITWCSILVAWAPTARGIAETWNRSETYAHGWVVAPIALWLMWRRRDQVWALRPQVSLLMALLIAVPSLLWLMGQMVLVNAASHFALVAVLVLSVPALLGWRVAHVLAFPLCFLFLAVPVGDFLLPQLMAWTAEFTVFALRFSGVPVYQEGLQFVIPSGRWSVVEACSGIRYLIASVMAGCLYGYLNYRSNVRRFWFVVFSVALALFANWLRAYLIVMLGHHSGNALATGVDHLIYGWAFFGLVIVVLFWVGSKWIDHTDSPDVPPVVHADHWTISRSDARTRAPFLVMTLSMTWIIASSWLLQEARQSISSEPVDLRPLAPESGWRLAVSSNAWTPAYIGSDASVQAAYVTPGDDFPVSAHIAYYRNQLPDTKMVSSSNVMVSTRDSDWAVVSDAKRPAEANGQFFEVRESELLSKHLDLSERRMRAWQLYWVSGRLTSSSTVAKLLGVWQLAKGQGDDGAIITLYTANTQDSSARLDHFLKSHGEALISELDRAQGRD